MTWGTVYLPSSKRTPDMNVKHMCILYLIPNKLSALNVKHWEFKNTAVKKTKEKVLLFWKTVFSGAHHY